MELSRAGEGQNRDRDTPSSLMSLCAPGESSASPTCKVSSACCQDFNSSGMGIPEGSPCRRQSLALVPGPISGHEGCKTPPASSRELPVPVLLGQEDFCAIGTGGFLCCWDRRISVPVLLGQEDFCACAAGTERFLCLCWGRRIPVLLGQEGFCARAVQGAPQAGSPALPTRKQPGGVSQTLGF